MKKLLVILSLVYLISCTGSSTDQNESQTPKEILSEKPDTSMSDKQQIADATKTLKEERLDSILFESKKSKDDLLKGYYKNKKIKLVKDPQFSKDSNSVNFKLCDVKLAKKSLTQRSYKWAIQARPVKRRICG